MNIRRLLPSICCLVCLVASSLMAAPMAEWSQTFDPAGMESLIDVLPIEDDGYALVGTVYDDTGTSQLRVIRLDALGAVEWTYTSTEEQDIVPTSAIVSEDGGIVVAADRSLQHTVVTSVFVQKVAADGEWEWSKEYSDGNEWNLQHTLLLELSFGTLVIANTAVGEGSNGLHAILLPNSGTIFVDLNCSGMGDAVATDIAAVDEGVFLLSAGSFTGEDREAGWLIQLADVYHCGWMQQIEGDGAGAARAVVQTVDNEIFVCGSAVPCATYSSDAYIAKFSSDGTQLWYRIYGGQKLDYPADMVATPGGGAVVAGVTLDYGGKAGVLVFEVASGGEVLWAQVLGGRYDSGISIHPTPDGGYILGANCGPEEMSGCGGVRIIKLSHG